MTIRRPRPPWPCWLLGHSWQVIEFTDDPPRSSPRVVGRVCVRRKCRGRISQRIVDGVAFDLSPEEPMLPTQKGPTR